MKKTFLIMAAFICFSFGVITSDKTIKLDVTPAEVNVIYNALGKMPAEQVESLRAKIANQYNRQVDSTGKVK